MQVTIGVNAYTRRYDRNCRLAGSSNYPGSNLKTHPRYYVQKRETIGGVPQRFQFVATRSPIQDTSGPPPTGTRLDPFPSHLGMIYCERSVLSGLIGSYHTVRSRDGCGIEETLVSFCLNDRDVNVRPEHQLVHDWDKSHTYLNVQQIFTRDPMYILPIVQDKCKRFAEFRLQGKGGRGEVNYRRTIRHLRGSLLAKYDYAFAAYQCNNVQHWNFYENSYLLTGINTIDDSNDALNTVFDNFLQTGGYTWYLCMAWEPLRRVQINPNLAVIPENMVSSTAGPSHPGENSGNNQGPSDPETNPAPRNSRKNPGNNPGLNDL